MTKLLTTSVVRGSNQGESHGGIYLIDLKKQLVEQKLDWNTTEIDWAGRGADRGLRGLAFDDDTIYVAASDELFAYTTNFELIASWRNPYLKHCHEICVHERTLYLTSTGFDSVLGFNLDTKTIDWGVHFEAMNVRYEATLFDPRESTGPLLLNKLHVNNVYCGKGGMFITGLKTGGMLNFNGTSVSMSVQLPPGTHNAQPFRDGVLFNDTRANRLRYAGAADGIDDRVLKIPQYDDVELTHTDVDDSRTARQGFARGLCVLPNSLIAVGSSPSTVTIFDLGKNVQVMSVNLTMDVRNAIHGLEVWPFDF